MTAVAFLLLVVVTIYAAWMRRGWDRATRLHNRELTEERERHAAAQAALALRIDTMLDSMIEGIVVTDAHGQIALANRSAEEMFSFSRMMVGGTLLQAIRHHEVAALASRAASETRVIEHEVRVEGPRVRLLQVSAAALREPSGVVMGAVLVFHDVTQLRRLEAMRQDFVANVSHELRTPLSMIKSTVETLLDGAKDDPAVTARFLEIIDKHANRLALLIDDLLLLARLDSDRVDLNFQSVDLHLVAQDALDDAVIPAQARAVTLANEVTTGLIASVDPDRLRQVLANLIDNAIKYGNANGRVTITGRALDDGRVQLTVRDNGNGIPVEAQARIFERFYRVDKARSREQGGTGLGLAIVKNVIQAHGGEVHVESAPGAGTEFFITLPATRAT